MILLALFLVKKDYLMPLTEKQREFIIWLDDQTTKILKNKGEEELLITLADNMPKIKDIMDACTKDELNAYCNQYSGFFKYMKILERLAFGISKGSIKVP
jgi:hypothetical protein